MIKLKTADWEIENIETVLFDKDGTFIDLHYFWGKMTEMRAKKIIKTFNLSTDQISPICKFLGYNIQTKKMLPDGITALYSRVKIIEIFTKNLEELGIFTTTDSITKIFDSVSTDFYKNIQEYTKPIDTAINFIKKLKSYGIKIGIVTSDSVESTFLTLKHFEWENLFDTVIGRESSKETKESGIPTKMALQNLQTDPRKTVMIGDAPMDFFSAKNAGINKTILVATGQIEKKELQTYTEYIVNSLEEVECLKT